MQQAPTKQLLTRPSLQSQVLPIPRARKAAASIRSMGEVGDPRAWSLKQPFVTGREGSEENLRQGPQGAAVFLKVRGL